MEPWLRTTVLDNNLITGSFWMKFHHIKLVKEKTLFLPPKNGCFNFLMEQ